MPQLIHGDCLEVLPTLPDASIDCILADLPYGITKAKWDCEIPLDKLWEQYLRIAKENCPIVLFSSQPFTSRLISSNLEIYKYCWYWEKERGTGFLNAKKQPLRCIEEICVFYKKAKYNPQMVKLDKPYKHKLPVFASENYNPVATCENNQTIYKEFTHSYPKNILKYSRKIKGNSHSTQKPLDLMKYLVLTYTNENDLILDNTMGSGTTCLAAKLLKRDYIGIEKDKKFFDIAVERLKT